MKILLFFISIFLLLSCQANSIDTDTRILTDNNLETYYTGKKGVNLMAIDSPFSGTVLSYSVYSSGEEPRYDPIHWTLKGSDNGKDWVTIDERKDQKFCSRFQEIICVVQKPSPYTKYLLEASTAANDTLKIAEVTLSEKNMLAGWEYFKYPTVNFESLHPDTEGSKLYHQLVQNPDEYIKYHARKVAEILYYTDKDPMTEVGNIKYTLEDKPGVSAKGGNASNIHIFYSTQHIERSAKESLHKLDFETRGVLYHELTHGYQYEPKGIGNYGNNKTFWACIEGIADAVRAEAGYFDMSTRKPGGNWMDGYRTTGFFLQWLTTKDPDAIRKFHLTVKDLDVWSFDAAIRSVFGADKSIEGMWDEYQQFLVNN